MYRHPYQFLNRIERFVRREESNLNWREREIGEEGESNLNCEDKRKVRVACGIYRQLRSARVA